MPNEGMLVFYVRKKTRIYRWLLKEASHWQKPGFLTPLQCLLQVNIVLWRTTYDSVDGMGVQ